MRIPELLLSSSTSAVVVVALIKATLFLAIAQWIVASARSLSAASRHLLLSFALSTFLVIPIFSLLLPRVAVGVAAAPEAAAAVTSSVEPSVASSRLTPRPAAVTPPPAAPVITLDPWTMAVLVWAAGVLFLGIRLTIAAARLRSIVATADAASPEVAAVLENTRREMGVRAPVRALVSARVMVPMIWGVRSGTLLLPQNSNAWTEEQLHATIVHELGHLQRLDYVALTLMNVVASLFWFHPQVWTARRRALTEGELACDDLVLRSGARASEYASHLLNVARLMPRREPIAAILAMSRPAQLEGRMVAILSPSINRKAVGGKLIMSFTVGFMLLVAPLATLQLSAQVPAAAAPAILADAAGMQGQHAPHAQHRDRAERAERHTNTNRSMTGTCADYQHEFDTDAVVRGEQNLTYAGNGLAVQSQNGAVSVRHATGNTFAITACKSAGGLNDAAAQQVLSQITVQESNGKISASGPEGEHWSVDLIVTVPEGRAITVRGENGPISFNGVNATIDASVTNGPLSFHDSNGEIKGSAVNGPVSVSGGSGNVNVSTENGPLSLTLDGAAWVGGDLRGRTGNGPVRLTVPSNFQTGISLQTKGRGPFNCEGSICGEFANSDRPRRAAINATLGTSPARIFIEGGNGPVSVTQK